MAVAGSSTCPSMPERESHSEDAELGRCPRPHQGLSAPRPGPGTAWTEVEELRSAQFFQRARGKTMEVGFKLATGTLPLEPAASLFWLARSSPVLTLAVR